MYTPLQYRQPAKVSRFSSVTPTAGENFRQFSSLLKPEFALKISNYLPDGEGKMSKRKGLNKIFEVAGTNPCRILGRFTSTTIIFSYSTTVAYYNETTEVITNIKTNFTANTGFDGVRYGEYFFVCNGVDKIWRIDNAFAIAEVAAAPICKTLTVFGARLVAGNLSTDSSATKYSEIDTGSNPPFTTWSNSATASDGGLVSFRNAGAINEVVTLGDNVVVFADNGKWAYQINQVDSAGTIKKIDQTVIDRTDLGGNAAIVTDAGIFYINEGGLWQLSSLGQSNIAYSDQEFDVTYLLGKDYFDDLDFTGSSLAFDNVNNRVVITCRSSSASTNNYVIVYNVKTKAASRISGWAINNFFTDNDNTMWGSSSSATKVYKCFRNYDDDGSLVGTEYYQELNIGDFNVEKTLQKFMLQCDLSLSTILEITFDTFDREGVFHEAVGGIYYMSVTNATVEGLGYGAAFYTSSYGSSGGQEDGTLPVYDSYKPFLRNCQRIFVKIQTADTLPHTINLFQAEIKEKSPIRVRNITVS